MDKILEFILQNWFYIVVILCNLVSLIVLILKKNKNINNDFIAVLEMLPIWILEAESLEDKSMKYSYVFNKAVQLLVSLTGKDEKEVAQKYAVMLDDAIEKILAAPQKK